MPTICGANGCVRIPDRNPVARNNSSIMGYDSSGLPVFAGDQGRAIVSQSPGMVINNTQANPAISPVAQGPTLPNPVLANTVGYDAAGNPINVSDWNLGYRNSPQTPANMMRPNADPRDFTDRTREFFLGSSGNTGAPQGVPGQFVSGNGMGGMGGRYTFQPRFPGSLQSQYETLFGNALNRLNQRFAPGAESGIAPILNQARTEFQTRTIPGIAEAFTALPGAGGQRSSAFQGALSAAGAGLNENLAALQSGYDLDQQRHMLDLLRMSPYENVYEAGVPGAQPQGSSGFLPALAEAAVAGGLGFLTGGPGGAAAGAGGSLFNRWRNMRNTPPVAQAPMIPQQQAGLPPLLPEQQSLLNNISRTAAPGNNLTPQQVQQIQSITGGVNAGEDFARTFRQPQPQRITFPQTPQQAARFAGFNRAGVL